jgi:hypothetical protein
MAESLSIAVPQPSFGGGEPAGFTGAPVLSTLAGGGFGGVTLLSLPTVGFTQGANTISPYFLTLFEVVISGANCPPSAVYPAYGVRGVGASRAP